MKSASLLQQGTFRPTILYISDRVVRDQAASAAIIATGYDVITTANSSEAVALLFVMRNVVAVVIDAQSDETARVKLAHNLRLMRPHVPILLLRCTPLRQRPPWLDVCVMTTTAAAGLTSVVRSVVNREIECSPDPVFESRHLPLESMMSRREAFRARLIASLSTLLHLWRA
jgi:response regulator RpfG family c-di-GMP phosphodiesterase